MIGSVDAIYYSPTGTSEKIAESVAESLAKALAARLTESDKESKDGFSGAVGNTDLTMAAKPREFENTFAVIAAPVYGGRIAPTAIGRLRQIKAKDSLCAVVAVYGNRDYEDALLELMDEARSCGFVPVAAGAFIGEHSYSTEEYPIAQDRPDSNDLKKCREFGNGLAAHYAELLPAVKQKEGMCWQMMELPAVKGNYPYKEYNPSPATPQTDTARCVLCGRCIDMCPVSCIEMKSPESGQVEADKSAVAEDIIVSNPQICTKCCACVKGCPFGARIYNTPYSEKLHKSCNERKEPEWYFGRVILT